MSVLIPITGQAQQPTSVKLTTTNPTDILSFPAGTATIANVVGLVVANQHGSGVKVTIWWTENITDHCVFERVVPANDTITDAITVPLRLYAKETARKIRAQAATADVVTITAIHTLGMQQTDAAR